MFGRIVDALDKGLSWFEDWVLYLSVMVGLVSLTINVYLRYVHHYSLAWSEEMIRHIIVITTFIGLSAAIKNGSMVTIDALVQLVPRLRRSLSYISHGTVILFSVMIIYYGCQSAVQKFATFQETILLEIPLGVLFMLLPLTGTLMLIRTIQAIYNDIQAAKSKAAK